MLPSRLADVERTRFSRYCLYAPRVAGAMNLWHAFPCDPWQPDVDVVVAVPRLGHSNESCFKLLMGEHEARVVVEHQPLLLATRPALRGVSLADILEHTPGSRPPPELLVMLARAFDAPGVRVLRVSSPHQVIVSWDGDVVVDGLDPQAAPRPWGDRDVMRADIEACLLASVALGCTDYSAARRIVDEIAAGTDVGPVARAIISRFAPALSRARVVDPYGIVEPQAARTVLAGLARSLFRDRYERDRAFLEELALLPPSALASWERRMPSAAERAAREREAVHTSATTMIKQAVEERERVNTEIVALVQQNRALSKAPLAKPQKLPRGPSKLALFLTWLADAWVRLRHRVAAARVPRELQVSARPAPRQPVHTGRRRTQRRRRRAINLRGH